MDGRRLRAAVAGDGRRVVLVQVGSPNAGLLYDDWVQDAAGRGLTLITYDRPGYAGSSRQLGRMVADCAADVSAVLHGEFGVWLHRAVQSALASSIDGWTEDDIALFHSPWGFDPASISIPVKVWHGLEDRFVPVLQGRWLAEAIPGAQAELRDHDGHLTVAAGRIGEVHEWLSQYV